MSKSKTVSFKVNGMHCNGCAGKIKNNLGALAILEEAQIDVAAGKVKVVFDAEKSTLSEIKNKIEAAGFTVESVELE
ncbi:MAG: heavy-metal-associated domain-containing protein [Bacteriovorax sp.]